MSSGQFIVLEGIDASGTTTQCAALAGLLRERGHRVHTTFEPSKGVIGSQIRAWLGVDADAPSAESLALLFAADRLEHLRQIVRPALAAGEIVLCDRYIWSSFAYQGLDCDEGWVRQLNRNALLPDLAMWLDVPVDRALERSAARLQAGGAQEERFDAAALQRRLHDAYARFADDPEDRLMRVAADLPIAQLSAQLMRRCATLGL